MRRTSIINVLGALLIVGVTTNPSASQAEKITVFHGSKAEIFNTAKTPANGVYVVKPVRKKASKIAQITTGTPSQPRAIHTFVAGNTLWTRNTRTGKLVACFVGSSGRVGKSVIRCTATRAFRR